MNNKLLYLIAIFLLFIACQSSQKNKENIPQSKITIMPTDSTLVLENKGNYYYAFSSQFKDSLLFRLKLRSGKDGLSIYNIYTKKRKDIVLNNSEVRDLKKIRGFSYINKDSILFIGRTKIVIANSDAKVIFNNFFNNPTKTDYFPIECSNYSPPFVINNKVFFNKLIDAFTNNLFMHQDILLDFDLKERNLATNKNTDYPDSYLNKCWLLPDMHVSRTIADKKGNLVFSFPIIDSLFIYSLDQQKVIKKIYAKSRFKNKEVDQVDCDKIWDNVYYYKHYYDNILYSIIIFDPYRELFYRIVSLPKPDYDLKAKFKQLNIPFSIQIFDKDYNLIGESDILNLTPRYVRFDYFVSKEGLWISTNNPENPNYNEDELHFELFKIKEKK